jgi:hypothetical protein
MSSGDKRSGIGFYTVVPHEQHGLFGGLLVLNRNGRPLEFHCTAPLKPNRAQEILYGATLESYLYGEAIGLALLSKAAAKPEFVCVDRAAALAVRELVDLPVLLVSRTDGPGRSATPLFRTDAAHESTLRPFSLGRPVCLGNHKAAVHRRFADDEQVLTGAVNGLPETFDLLEPFERIRGAIDEAQRSGR